MKINEEMIVDVNDGICPFCGNNDLDYSALDATDMSQDVKCHECGKEWREYFQTVSIKEL